MNPHLIYTLWSLFLLGWASAAPPPTLFDTPWNDLSLFEADLVPARQSDLAALQDAPVYHLELTLSQASSTVTGREELRFVNTTGDLLSDVVFRLYPNALGATMTVANVQVDGQAVEIQLEAQNTALRVPLDSFLLPGEEAVVSLDFSLSLLSTSASYGRLARYKSVVSLADAYPTLSVYRDGAWVTEIPNSLGDPLVAETAFFLVRVRAPEEQQLVATGHLTETAVVDGQQTAVFAAMARDFYLAAATHYTLLSRPVGDTVVNAYVPADLVSGGERNLEVAAQALRLFSERFTPYPYRELDFVAVPVTASGIEYPGVINLANGLYGDSSGNLDSVVAHEVAHQWSFNLVGSDQIEEPWLDEALAQYLTLLYHRAYDSAAFVDGYLRFWRGLWLSAPDPRKAVGLPVAAYSETDYSDIVYGRGLFFYEALEERLGSETVTDPSEPLLHAATPGTS